MPLVTLTCSKKYYPPDIGPMEAGGFPTDEQMNVIEFAKDLPGLIAERGGTLHLDPQTSAVDVQVNIAKFHIYAVNSVDLWFRIEFTETLEVVNDRKRVVNDLGIIIAKWLREHDMQELSWALDVFWGPGHGCYTNSQGDIVQSW